RHTRSKRDWSSDVCSSDLALLALVRLAETEADLTPVLTGAEGSTRLLALLGASAFWVDYLVAHPDQVAPVLHGQDGLSVSAYEMRRRLLHAVGADPQAHTPVAAVRAGDGGADDMRRTYRH